MTIDVSEAEIESVAIYRLDSWVEEQDGGKSMDEEVSLSPEIRQLLQRFFLAPLKLEELYSFSPGGMEEDVSAYAIVKSYFEGKGGFVSLARQLADLLKEVAQDTLQEGNLYVARFVGVLIDGEKTEALGLFKSETREVFINPVAEGNGFRLEYGEGFGINRMDRGCLICNVEKNKGFVVSAFDHVAKGRKAPWLESFLDLRERRDSKFYTENTVKNIKEFITKELPRKKEVSKDEEFEVMDKTMEYFKENERFDRQEYEQAVFPDEETRKEFSDFLSCQNDGLDDWDQFPISPEGVKKSSKFLKKVIKLDKDFSIHIHGNANFLQKGFDQEYGLKYYKIFYTEEH